MNETDSEHSPQATVHIEKWVQNGLALAHMDGRTVFVHGALPGETVRIRIVKERSQHFFAICEEVLEPAVGRIAPDCPVFPACGGCSFRHMDYEEEVQLKLSLLTEQKFLAPQLESMQVKTGPRNHYRNQVRLHSDKNSRGFFSLHTNEIVELPTTGCMNLSETLNRRLRTEEELELRDYLTEKAAGSRQKDAIPLPGMEFSWRLPSTGFSQANRFLIAPWLETMYDLARPYLHGSPEQGIYELFCGAGLIGGYMLLRARSTAKEGKVRYYGAESYGPALEKGKSNFRAAGIKARLQSTDLYRSNVAQFLGKQFPDPAPESLIIANPPRAGLKEKLVHWISSSKARVLLYSSCNPQTLNRDVGILERGGFQLSKLHWFDFFPGTPHAELVALLERP